MLFYLRIFFGFSILIFQIEFLYAQDAHFSQINSLPTLINPAQTGFYSNNDYRIGAIYRLQKTPSGSAYNTFLTWADMSMQPLYNEGWFGVGTNFIHDNTSGSILSLNKYIVSLAYHQPINDDMILSLGVSGSYVDRSLDHSKLIFGDQFDGVNFSNNIPTEENLFIYPNSRYWTIRPAINFSHYLENNSRLSVGFSIDNVNRPTAAFIGGNRKQKTELGVNSQGYYTVPLRYHANAYYSRDISYNLTWSIYTYFTYQNRAMQNLIGTKLAYNYFFNGIKTLSISGGFMYRVNRSANLLVGLETDKVKLGLSYDLAITKTSFFLDNYNSFELSCIFHSVLPKINQSRNKLKRKIRCVDNF